MKPEMYRQGDVLLVKVESLPQAAEEMPPDERIVLAYGEVTGHAHAISQLQAKMYADGTNRYLRVDKEGADLVHEEHSTIHLPEGFYRVVRQREYEPASVRFVAD